MRNYIQIVALSLVGLAIPLIHYSKGYFFIALVLGTLLGLSSLSLADLKAGFAKVFNKKYLTLVAPVALVIVLSVFFAVNQDYSLRKLTDLAIVLGVSSLLAVFLSVVSKEKMNIILSAMLGGVVFNLCFLCYDMFFAPFDFLIKFHGKDNFGTGRVRYVVSQIAVVAPLLFGFLYYIKGRKNLAFLFLAFTFFVVVASGGRSALFSFFVGFSFLFITMAIKSKKFSFKKFVILSIATLSLFATGIFGYKTLDARFESNQFEKRMSLGSSDISSGRFDIWKFAWDETLKRPAFGAGIGGFKTLAESTDIKLLATNHPHNFIFEILISVGFIGFLVIGLVLSYIFFNLLLVKKGGFAVFAATSFFSYWVNSLTSVSIIQTYWLALFAVSFIIGYFIVLKEER